MTVRLPSRSQALVLGLALFISALGCSAGGLLARAPRPTPTPTPTLRPTFTPTAPGSEAGVLPAATIGDEGALPLAAAGSAPGPGAVRLTDTAVPTPPPPTPLPTLPPPTPYPTPWVTVIEDVVNVRAGPDLAFEQIGEIRRGETYAIQARTADSGWWQICCPGNRIAWVVASFVRPEGVLAYVPIAAPQPTPIPSPTPSASPTPSITPTPIAPFDVARGLEFPFKTTNPLLTIWVWVYEGRPGAERSLPGYRLRVLRDSVDVSTDDTSHGDPPDTTSPLEGSFKYNLKVELKDPGEADWVIYLVDANGNRQSPERSFTTRGTARDNLVVYVAYIRLF